MKTLVTEETTLKRELKCDLMETLLSCSSEAILLHQ